MPIIIINQHFHQNTGNLCTEEFTSQPPVQSVRVEDILEVIDADIIIMKIDIEGYECKVDIISLTLQYKLQK